MRQPGIRLRYFASLVCSRSTMERLIDPVIGDLLFEHDSAIRAGRIWRSRWILLAGYVAFWRVFAVHAPVWAARSVRGWAAADDWAIGRTLGFTMLGMTVLTAALILPPLQSVTGRLDSVGRYPWMVASLLPQAIPLSLPFGLLVGVLCGLRGRATTNRIRRRIVVVGLVSSIAMVATIGWLVPVANQAFRVAVAGREISRGVAEIPPPQLREQALAMKASGHLARAGSLLLDYHVRWALAGSAFAFALFGIGVSALRQGRMATVTIAGMGCVVYVAYFWLLNPRAAAAFSDEWVAATVSWLPNVMLILVSLAFLWDRATPTAAAEDPAPNRPPW